MGAVAGGGHHRTADWAGRAAEHRAFLLAERAQSRDAGAADVDLLIRRAIAVVVFAVADLGGGRSGIGCTDNVEGAGVADLNPAGHAGAAADRAGLAQAKLFVGGAVTVVVEGVALLGAGRDDLGHRASHGAVIARGQAGLMAHAQAHGAVGANAHRLLVDDAVTVIIDAIAHLDRGWTAVATGVAQAFVNAAITVIVDCVAGLGAGHTGGWIGGRVDHHGCDDRRGRRRQQGGRPHPVGDVGRGWIARRHVEGGGGNGDDGGRRQWCCGGRIVAGDDGAGEHGGLGDQGGSFRESDRHERLLKAL